MSDVISYRRATVDDIEDIFRIRLAVSENALSDTRNVTPKLCATYLTVSGKGWICESNGQAVGFSIACSTNDSIWALFLLPDFEGQKIGRKLLQLAVEWLFENGASSITLSTGVGTRADRFYEQQGWSRGELLTNGEVCFRLDRRSRS